MYESFLHITFMFKGCSAISVNISKLGRPSEKISHRQTTTAGFPITYPEE